MNRLTEVGKLSVSRKWKEFQEASWGEFEQQVSGSALDSPMADMLG